MRRTENGRYLAMPAGFEAISFSAVQYKNGHTLTGRVRFFYCDTGIHETRFCESKNGVRRSSRKGASAFADCGVGSTRNFS